MKKGNEKVLFVFNQSIIDLLAMENSGVSPIKDKDLDKVLEALYNAPGVGKLVASKQFSNIVKQNAQVVLDRKLAESLSNYEYKGEVLGEIVWAISKTI